MVMVPVLVPVPMFVADEPDVLMFVTPAIVAPPVAVRAPPKVRLSQSVAVLMVEVAASLDQ